MTNPRSLLDDLTLTPVAGIDGRYSLTFDAGWKVLYVFGGVTFATGVHAVVNHIGRDDLTPVSAQATYIQPVLDGPAAVQVEVIRVGKRGAQARASIWNTVDPAADAMPAIVIDVVLGAPDSSVGGFDGLTFPADALTPEQGHTRQEMSRVFIDVPFHHQTDFRLVGDPAELERPEPRSLSWFKMTVPAMDETGAWVPAAIGLPGDMLGPAVGRAMAGARYFVVTLQLSIQWFAPARTEWILQHAHGIHAANGFTTGITELWDQEGTLVALATQAALMRPFERVQADGFGSDDTQG